MSKNPSILEGGRAKTASNVKRLVTTLQGGGNCYWVPEDERLLRTKYINKNGLYLPEDDSVYAFSKLTVNVPGGAAGFDVPTVDENGTPMPSPTSPDYDPDVPTYGPVEVNTDLQPTEIPSIDGGIGSQIVGIDPIDGDKYVVGVDDNGEITKKKIPSEIRITIQPRRTEYDHGDAMDYSGIEVRLFDANGNVFNDDKYPDGIIPFNELVFPISTAPKSEEPHRYTSEIDTSPYTKPIPTNDTVEAYGWYNNTHGMVYQVYAPVGDAKMLLAGVGKGGAWNCVYVASSEESPTAVISCRSVHTGNTWQQGVSGHTSDGSTVRVYTSNGKTVYFREVGYLRLGDDVRYHDGDGILLRGAFMTPQMEASYLTVMGPSAWTVVYGDDLGGTSEIPVQWVSVYDNVTMETSFRVSVLESGLSDAGEETGSEGGGGGGHSF